MPHAETEVPHVAFTHHHIGIHPLTGERTGEGTSPVHALSERTEALVWYQVWQRVGSDRLSTTAQLVDGRVDELLAKLPWEAVDVHIEVARAELFTARGEQEAAEQAALRALDFDHIGTDELARSLYVLATVHFGQNRFDEARLEFEKLSHLRRSARDWYYLGLCESNCGHAEAAIRALRKSLELDPASVGTSEALAAIHHTRHEFDAEQRLRATITRLNLWQPLRGERNGRSR
jgi:tetratricopeptide (TPR) repeat protein